MLSLKTTYRDDNTAFFIQTHILPGFLLLFPPPVTASLSRRLFRDSLTEGRMTVHTGPELYVTFNIVSPTAFNFTTNGRQNRPPPSERLGSASGFAIGTQSWTYGATLGGLGSCLKTSVAYTFEELALQVKLGIEWGFTGLAMMLTGAWQHESTEIAASVGLNAQGVLMNLE
jgi:DnaJ homolog subfamily C member 11